MSPAETREPPVAGLQQLRASCPSCSTPMQLGRVTFVGIPVVCEALCESCGSSYWLHLPTGHALLHPVVLNRTTGEVFHDGGTWYPNLVAAILDPSAESAGPPITVRTARPSASAAVVVDCLDTVYGHVLMKLFGGLATLRAYPQDPPDAIFVVPTSLAWLVPNTVHTVIAVDLPPRSLDRWIDGLDEELRGVLSAYETVIIAPGESQPVLAAEDFSHLSVVPAATQFWQGDQPCQVTFVLRDDRVWVGHEGLGLRIVWRLLPRRVSAHLNRLLQLWTVSRTAARLRQRLPAVRVVALGVGRPGGLRPWIEDQRSLRPTQRVESAWHRELARGGTVVGVHGSHLLFPSALGGAVIELVPWYKLRNVAQDLIITDGLSNEAKLVLFRYRILPADIGARALARVIESTLVDREYHLRVMLQNRSSAGSSAWPPRGRSWRRLDPPA